MTTTEEPKTPKNQSDGVHVYKIYDTQKQAYCSRPYETQAAAVGQAGEGAKGLRNYRSYRQQTRFQVHKMKLEFVEVIY